MRDPVVAMDGHSYERKNIERWLREKSTSPMTGATLDLLMLLPNHALRTSIREYMEQQEPTRRGAAGIDTVVDTVADGHYYVVPENTATPEGAAPSCAVVIP